MKTSRLVWASFAAILICQLTCVPAQAQALRTWVASFGSGTACTRALPCADVVTAYNATLDGGEINCLDASGDLTLQAAFGPFTITKSITIDCAGTASPGKLAGELVIDQPGIVVTLRNLAITPSDDGTGFLRAISFLRGSALHIENCRIANYHFGGTPLNGFDIAIRFAPSAGITGALFVSDTVIADNGFPASGGGIVIQPTGTGSARVLLDRVRVEQNAYGVFANGMGSTGTISVQIRDSVVSSSTVHGISAFTAAGQSITSITVDRSSSVLNGGAGIYAQGPNAFVLLGGSTVASNSTGLSAADSGNIYSYQDNQLSGNVSDGAPTAALTVK